MSGRLKHAEIRSTGEREPGMKIIWQKVKIRFLQDLDISGKVQPNKGEIREAQIYDGYCYIDFGKLGIAKAPLADMAGNFEIIEGGNR